MIRVRQCVMGAALLLLAVPAARAEDAVVPNEFEQQQAVDACDAYGSGYFKLPGTATCAKVSGELRYEKHFSSGGKDRTGGGGHLDFETRSD